MIRCIPFEFWNTSCNWNTNWNLNFQIFSPFDRSSALELQFFALCPTFKRSQTPSICSGSNIDPPFELLSQFSTRPPPLNYTGLKFENLDGCESRGTSLIRSFDIRRKKTIGIETHHSIFTFNIPDIYLFDDPTFQRRQPFTLTSPLSAFLPLPRLLIDLKTPLAFPINNRTMYSAAVNNEFPRFTFLSVHLALKLGRANSACSSRLPAWKPLTLIEPKWFQGRIRSRIFLSKRCIYVSFLSPLTWTSSKRLIVEGVEKWSA